jgi:uncharacterized protein YbjT (DUF2867 family)
VKVLVIGGTGMLGTPVTKALAQAGHEVTALVRRTGGKLPAGVREAVGDLFDAASLAAAMRGQQALYLNLATQPTDTEAGPLAEREGLKNALDAARAAGVTRVLTLAPLVAGLQGKDGFDWWVFRVKQAAEQAVLASGLTATVFRASSFMENFNGSMRSGQKLNLAGTAKFPSYYLAGEDLGRLVVAALAREQVGNKVYFAQGPEALLPEVAAKRFIAARPGPPLSLQKAPLGVLAFIGVFSRSMGFVAKMLGALNRYEEVFQAKETWAELGEPTVRLEDFAKRTA